MAPCSKINSKKPRMFSISFIAFKNLKSHYVDHPFHFISILLAQHETISWAKRPLSVYRSTSNLFGDMFQFVSPVHLVRKRKKYLWPKSLQKYNKGIIYAHTLLKCTYESLRYFAKKQNQKISYKYNLHDDRQ